jgi:hypothetical protein
MPYQQSHSRILTMQTYKLIIGRRIPIKHQIRKTQFNTLLHSDLPNAFPIPLSGFANWPWSPNSWRRFDFQPIMPRNAIILGRRRRRMVETMSSPCMPRPRVTCSLQWNRVQDIRIIERAADISQNFIRGHEFRCIGGILARTRRVRAWSIRAARTARWRFDGGLSGVLPACLATACGTSPASTEPFGEAMAETESARGKTFLVCRTDSAARLNIRGICLGRERCEQWMKDIS